MDKYKSYLPKTVEEKVELGELVDNNNNLRKEFKSLWPE